MIKVVSQKARELKIGNVQANILDFLQAGSGLREASIDYVFLFNIFHLERPETLLKEARRILKIGGKVAIIHWNYDPTTPRGPPMEIRPRPEQIRLWAESVGLIFERQLDIKPYHYGIILRK